MSDDWKTLKREFVDTGYVLLHDWLDPQLVQDIQQDAHGDIAIFERQSVGDLLCHARIVDFISFLLESSQVAISPFRFWNHLEQGRIQRRRRLARR